MADTDNTLERFAQFVKCFEDYYFPHFISSPDDCQSPIEQTFYSALVMAHSLLDTGFNLYVNPQEKILNYRVDFCVKLMSGHEGIESTVLVECDGHDFHEKNKTQASRDKQKDRDLQREGFSVFRFTGSDIWNNPFKCAEEVIDFLIAQLSKARKEKK